MASTTTIGIATERFDRMVCSQCDSAMDIANVDPFTRIECPNCSHPATVPAKLGNFLLLDLIGTGGMGGVFIAEDESLDRLVAIKVMLKKLGDNHDSVATFKREAQAAAKLNHAGIAQIYSIGQEGGQPYIVMELVGGQSLDELTDADKPINEALLLRIAIGVAQALSAAEEIGLVHGDIKPENILLDDRERPKLVDFGLASFADQAAAEGVWGTPYYIAPEKVSGCKGDARSDIYSLGATMFHALCAEPPFDGETPTEVVKARLENPAPPLKEKRPDISEKTAAIVARMLETEPSRRYPTYMSLINDMRRAMETQTVPDRTGRLQKRSKRNVSLPTAKLPRVTQNIDPAVAALPPGRRPKIVVRTKKTKLTGPALESIRRQSTVTNAPRTAQKKGPTPDDAEAAKAAKRARSKRVLTTCLILLLLAAAGGLAWFLYDRQQGVERRREMFALEDAKTAASNLLVEVESGVAALTAAHGEAGALVASVTNSMAVVLDLPYSDDLLSDAPAEAADGMDEGVQADGEDVEAEAVAPDEPAEAPVEEDAPAGDVAEGGGDATNEVVEADAPPAADEEAPVPLLGDRDFMQGDLDDMDVQALARVAFGVQTYISALGGAVAPVLEDAKSLAEGAQRAVTSAAAGEALTRLEEKTTLVAERQESASKALQRSRRAAKRAGRLADDVLAERKASRAQADRAAAAAAAAAAAERAAEEQRLKVQADALAVSQTRAACLAFVQQYDFARAVKAAKDATQKAQTDEGRRGFSVLVDRYTRLRDLKAFLIRKLNEQPEPWIWGGGRGAKDVTGADDKQIQIRGGDSVPWAEVSIAQMLKFINVYAGSRKIRIREQCNSLLAAAIFCLEYGGSGRASQAARNYADRAVNVCNDLQDEVDRLLDYNYGQE